MTEIHPLQSLAEKTLLLLSEVTYFAEQLYAALQVPMDLIQSGRSPQAMALAEKIAPAQAYAQHFQGALQDFELALKAFNQQASTYDDANLSSALVAQSSQLESELQLWQEFKGVLQTLLQKFKLVSQEDQLTSLGRMPIEDAWFEMEEILLSGSE